MQERIAIIFGSSEGQTEKIARRIADVLRDHGADVATMHADEMPLDYALENSDAVLIGASIHVARHQPFVVEYVSEHAEQLASKPNGFFSVSLSAHGDDDIQSVEYVERFQQETGWEPKLVARFRGALRYSKYSWLTRPLMKKIAAEAGADTDTSQDWEYTDWGDVEAFAHEFLEMVSNWRAKGGPQI